MGRYSRIMTCVLPRVALLISELTLIIWLLLSLILGIVLDYVVMLVKYKLVRPIIRA